MSDDFARTPAWRGWGERLPQRDFIRDNCHNGRQGLTVEDLDLIVRTYGFNKHTDSIGRIRLLELKYLGATLGVSKIKTFGMIDLALRTSPFTSDRYDGFWLARAQTNTPDVFWKTPTSSVELQLWQARETDMELQRTDLKLQLELDQYAQWLNGATTPKPTVAELFGLQ